MPVLRDGLGNELASPTANAARELPKLIRCGHLFTEHPDSRNMLAGGAERDGRVCALGWAIR